MPLSSKRSSSHASPSDCGIPDGASGSAKKQKTDSAAVSPITEPEPVVSSVEVKVKTEDAPMSSDRKTVLQVLSNAPMSSDRKTVLQVLSNIKENPTRVDTVKAAFGFLQQLVRGNKDEDLMNCIIDADGISSLATIMKENPGEDGLHTECCALFGLLFDSVKQNPEEEGIKAFLNVVETLKKHEEFMKYTVTADVISVVTTILKEHPNEKGLRAECQSVLELLCETVEQNPKQGGIIKAICTVMESLPGDAAMQTKCCRVIWSLTKKSLEFNGAIPLIVSALKSHPNDEALAERGLEALGRLAGTYRYRNGISDAGGVGVVVDALSKYSKNVNFRCGIKILKRLARDWQQPLKSTIIVKAGGHREVVSFMNNHLQNAQVQADGCSALAYMAYYDTGELKMQIVDVGVVPALVKAMQQHRDNKKLQRDACFALYNLSKGGGKSILAAMNETGVLSVLGAAIQAHPKNSDIKTFAKEAWDRLVESLSNE